MTNAPKPCDACHAAETNPAGGRYRSKCRGCAIRALANGPHFHQRGIYAGDGSPYRTQLGFVFGTELDAGHALVLAEFKRIKALKAEVREQIERTRAAVDHLPEPITGEPF